MLWLNSWYVPLLLCADAPHMWSVRPAHVVRMADTCGAEHSHKSFLVGNFFCWFFLWLFVRAVGRWN